MWLYVNNKARRNMWPGYFLQFNIAFLLRFYWGTPSYVKPNINN